MRVDDNSSTRNKLDFLALPSPLMIIGGAYTGKSMLAHQALLRDQPATVIGTNTVQEEAIQESIKTLQAARSPLWTSLDAGTQSLEILREALRQPGQVLFDSVNQWLANVTLEASKLYTEAQLEDHILFEGRQLCSEVKMRAATNRIILVSSEVGAGLSPPSAVARIYRQATSRTNCYLAEVCASVVLISAGIPLLLKG